jgi:hypothetical protein
LKKKKKSFKSHLPLKAITPMYAYANERMMNN